MAQFDLKNFNPEAFGRYVDAIPRVKLNELVRSGAVQPTSRFRSALTDQTGGNFASFPMFGRIGGEALNYDGQTTITASSTSTYLRSVVVVGRAKGWTEKDFSSDITGGVDFMGSIARQVADYKQDLDQSTILTTLEGIFAMTDTADAPFVGNHTFDITGTTTGAGVGLVAPETLNTAIQQACGDNKQLFSLAIMHSAVATNLENQKLLKFMTQTDALGIERQLPLATWNGRIVLVDDSMPVTEVSAGVNNYTTYVLGNGAFEYDNVGAKVPHEMVRDAKTNGGENTLIMRQRKVFAPYGISFTRANMVSLSPTDAELRNGANWTTVIGSDGTRIPHKAIPIARIISRG